jgi:2-polyprenyl-3-methyl-5-hydroxy-6-metoxy-1,4-benzoquinol methylase
MIIDTTYRTQAAETMDDFTLEGKTLRDALDKIAAINRFLGGNRVTLEGIEALITEIPHEQEITIVDVGCGNGDMLRLLANYAIKNDRHFKLIGIDANRFTVNYARQLSEVFPNIHYECRDIFEPGFENMEYDIALCTLTMHHFKEDEIMGLLSVFKRQSKIGIVINDLERSWLAYRLFQALAFVCGLNKMSREDGLLSILRGFKKPELVQFSQRMGFKNAIVRWKWAFRYQWIIPV